VIVDLTVFRSLPALRSELVSHFPDLEQTLSSLGVVAAGGDAGDPGAVQPLDAATLAAAAAGDWPAAAVVAVPNARFVRVRLVRAACV
jgi:hypothetical protein